MGISRLWLPQIIIVLLSQSGGLWACSKSSEGAAASTAATEILSAHQLYARIQPLIANQDLVLWRATPLAQVYADALGRSSDAAVRISDVGVSWSQLRSTLIADESTFAAMARTFPTLGDLEQAGLVRSPHSFSEVEFRDYLQTLGTDRDLSLTALQTTAFHNPRNGSPGPTPEPCILKLGANAKVMATVSPNTGKRYLEYCTNDRKLAPVTLIYFNGSNNVGKIIKHSDIEEVYQSPTGEPGVIGLNQDELNQKAAELTEPFMSGFNPLDTRPEGITAADWEHM